MSSNRNRDEMTGALVRRADQPTAIEKPTPIDFADHGQFHVTVAKAALGGGAAAFVLGVAGALGFHIPPELFAIASTAGVMAGVAARKKNWWRTAIGGVLGATGAGLALATGEWPLFAAALLGASTAPVLARGESWKRMSVTGAVAGAFGSAGLFVAEWMVNRGILQGIVPGPLAMAAAGAAVGLFFGLASAPKHISRPNDPVEGKYLEALQIKDGELYEILARALSIHESVKSDLAQKKDEKTVQKLGERVGELAMRILAIVEQCRRIESDLAAAPAFELEERIGQLRRKADAATDAAARDTYLAAVESLDGQRRAFDAINRGRERVIARLHANVALLEKVRFSLLHMRSADAERIGGEASPLTEALEELSRELDLTSSAVGEVFGRQGASISSGGAVPSLPVQQIAAATPSLELVESVNAEDTEPQAIAAGGVIDHRKS
jgi:hypothetical protein